MSGTVTGTPDIEPLTLTAEFGDLVATLRPTTSRARLVLAAGHRQRSLQAATARSRRAPRAAVGPP